MKLWLDDMRPMPPGFDIATDSAKSCIRILEKETAALLSFDHDLGAPKRGTGYDVAKWIEEEAFHGRRHVVSYVIHSANTVGAKNINQAMRKAESLLKDKGK